MPVGSDALESTASRGQEKRASAWVRVWVTPRPTRSSALSRQTLPRAYAGFVLPVRNAFSTSNGDFAARVGLRRSPPQNAQLGKGNGAEMGFGCPASSAVVGEFDVTGKRSVDRNRTRIGIGRASLPVNDGRVGIAVG